MLAPLGIGVLAVAAWVLFIAAERVNRRDERRATGACLLGSAALAVLTVGSGWWWVGSLGIDPTASSYGAAVATLLGYVALHLLMGAVMALWCLLRLGLGMIDSLRCPTLRVCLLWWHVTAPATVLALLLIAALAILVHGGLRHHVMQPTQIQDAIHADEGMITGNQIA